ncbi:hypothetical protein CHISP_2405 [Chitinispirillum alkaliphilum]|nr:hypothetical protein CHISP_2405 [Chitinispirillum alkaliphilum]
MVQTLILFDISAIIVMLVLAYLSRRLGEALKIKPYYKFLNITALSLAVTATLDIITTTNDMTIFSFPFSMLLRCSAAFVALIVVTKYWKWLFAEFFKK